MACIVDLVAASGEDVRPEHLQYPLGVASRLTGHYPPPARDRVYHLISPVIENILITSRTELTRIKHMLGDLATNAADRLLCESYATTAGWYGFRFVAAVASRQDARLSVWHGSKIVSVFQTKESREKTVSTRRGLLFTCSVTM
ncbi:uncharacterized protein B0H64DRAFT_444816 [Chaetomium fimeti]|uniref:Uncharacterized protein n=1 Tax=Chaetomium fimeti TaxID=1854472 RepID=A0AAE0HBP6_9PEZI|nr:hypothetical protein B0H64DRAFT_444816 [Chaetomium fimeti]